MIAIIKSCGLIGIDGYIINVETDIQNGIPSFEVVGLGDTAVKEAKERVRSAIKNSGLEFPVKRITINLAPADLKKEGSFLDLPIALGILTAIGTVSNNTINDFLIAGELSLDGTIKPIKGALSIAICALENGIKNFILPVDNADEASVIKNLNVFPANN